MRALPRSLRLRPVFRRLRLPMVLVGAEARVLLDGRLRTTVGALFRGEGLRVFLGPGLGERVGRGVREVGGAATRRGGVAVVLGRQVRARRVRHLRRRRHLHRLRRIAAGAVDVDLERYDVADALVVDAGQDRVPGGERETVEVVQDRALDRLPGRGHDRHPADRGTALRPHGAGHHGPRRRVSGRRHVHLDRRGPGGLLPSGTGRRALPLEFPLLFAAESRHRFPHEGVVEDGVGDGIEGEAGGADEAGGDAASAASTVVTSATRQGRPPAARVSLR